MPHAPQAWLADPRLGYGLVSVLPTIEEAEGGKMRKIIPCATCGAPTQGIKGTTKRVCTKDARHIHEGR